MLKKKEQIWQSDDTLEQYRTANAGLLSTLLPPSPGSAGRWQLKDDPSGLQSSAQMYLTAQKLTNLQVRELRPAFTQDTDACAPL
jgi:hypothetical protein